MRSQKLLLLYSLAIACVVCCGSLWVAEAPAAGEATDELPDPKQEMRMFWSRPDSALGPQGIRPRFQDAPTEQPSLLVVLTDAAGPGPEAVQVEALAPGGIRLASAAPGRGDTVRFDTSAWPDGPYEVRVAKALPDGTPYSRYLKGYKGDWAAQARQAMEDAQAVPEDARTPGELRVRVVGQLVSHALGGAPGMDTTLADPDGWRKVHSTLMEHGEAPDGNAGGRFPGGFVRLAWVDEVDDSPQFARAYLPDAYDGGERWPLVVRLHGYNAPNPEYAGWWGVRGRHNGLANQHGVIWLEPHGRGNTGYAGIGDLDVLTAVRVAKETFAVDDDRVYLTGTSMGGGGTWYVGTRHPEVFAAIAPVYGGWDYHVWMEREEFSNLTPLGRFANEASSSFAQAEALLTTPVFINHGDQDAVVEVEFSRYVARMLQRWGYDVRYWEHPGLGHKNAVGANSAITSWFLEHRRISHPRRVRVRSADLESAAAHWVRVEQREDPLAFVHVDAQVLDDRTIRLDTENVLQIALSPGASLVSQEAPVRVVWNGKEASTHRLTSGTLVLKDEAYEPSELRKTPEVDGPASDVTTTPFAIVAGTSSEDDRMRRFCVLRAEAARDSWEAWQHVTPRYFLDTEITDEQISAYSLLLYGGPDENLVTRRLAGGIPLRVAADAIEIDGQAFRGRDLAVAMVYPHPLNPNRYVLVRAGSSAAGVFLMDLPDVYDFAVSESRMTGDGVGVSFEEACVVAGRFDHGWRFREDYAVRGDPVKRARASLRKAPKHLTAVVDTDRLTLSEVLESRASGSFSKMGRDMNWLGRPIVLGAKTYRSGIGVAALYEPCRASYDLAGGGWKLLRATIGIEVDKPVGEIEEKEMEGTRVFFVVRGDGKELYRSPAFLHDSCPVELEVNVEGVQNLELEVGNDAGWLHVASSVNWGDLRLEK